MRAREDADALCHALDDVMHTAAYFSRKAWRAIARKRHSGKERVGNHLALRRVILLAMPLLCVCPASAQASKVAEQKITATWNFNYSPVPACGFSLFGKHSNCVAGFQFGEWNGSACSNLKQVGNPSDAKGQVNGIGTSLTVTAGLQDATFCVAARYYDSSGTLLLGPVDLAK